MSGTDANGLTESSSPVSWAEKELRYTNNAKSNQTIQINPNQTGGRLMSFLFKGGPAKTKLPPPPFIPSTSISK